VHVLGEDLLQLLLTRARLQAAGFPLAGIAGRRPADGQDNQDQKKREKSFCHGSILVSQQPK
jgi:hypothetical protein